MYFYKFFVILNLIRFQLGASPLPDNESTDKYIYEILVYTGHQGNAGTKSNVILFLFIFIQYCVLLLFMMQ